MIILLTVYRDLFGPHSSHRIGFGYLVWEKIFLLFKITKPWCVFSKDL